MPIASRELGGRAQEVARRDRGRRPRSRRSKTIPRSRPLSTRVVKLEAVVQRVAGFEQLDRAIEVALHGGEASAAASAAPMSPASAPSSSPGKRSAYSIHSSRPSSHVELEHELRDVVRSRCSA